MNWFAGLNELRALKTTGVQLTSSRVRLGQSFKTVGCGCTSCWGDVGAGSVEADVFYIPFIVSVQYIGTKYRTETRYKYNRWFTG